MILAFAAFSYFYSRWFLIGLAAFGLWKLNRWYFYSSRPWRKAHYPMMRAYAGAAGIEASKAQAEGRDFDIRLALHELLRAVNPELSIGHKELIEREFQRSRDFYDEPLIRGYLVDKKGADPEKIDDLLGAFREHMQTPNKGLIVRLVIASVIEEQFSSRDRGEYLFEVFSGRAK